MGAGGVTLSLLGSKIQDMVLANQQAYEPLCDKYGKNTVDFLISSGNDAGLSLLVLGYFSILKAVNEGLNENAFSRRLCDRWMRLGVIAFSLVPILGEVNELINPAMPEVCQKTGLGCGSPGDLLVFAFPAIVVLPGLIKNYISTYGERRGKVKNS